MADQQRVSYLIRRFPRREWDRLKIQAIRAGVPLGTLIEAVLKAYANNQVRTTKDRHDR